MHRRHGPAFQFLARRVGQVINKFLAEHVDMGYIVIPCRCTTAPQCLLHCCVDDRSLVDELRRHEERPAPKGQPGCAQRFKVVLRHLLNLFLAALLG
jgi:hypothetical protein